MRDMIEQVKDATTPEEMRAEIFRLQYYDALVRAVMDSANYTGMGAEDRYTVLAYHALRAKNKSQALVYECVRTSVMPQILVPPSGASSEMNKDDKGQCGRDDPA